MSKFLFVLRGRPGLGHVIPGLSIGRVLEKRGHYVRYVTYSEGSKYLKGCKNVDVISIEERYDDWPGLHPYDHGIRSLMPIVNQMDPDLVVLGGEYLLPASLTAMRIPAVCMLNLEVFDDNDRNRVPSALFTHQFKMCVGLIALDSAMGEELLPEFEAVARRLIAGGPFRPEPAELVNPWRDESVVRILICNGGGVSFPMSSASYGDSAGLSWRKWLADITNACIQAASDFGGPEGEVVAFSCLAKDAIPQGFREANVEVLPAGPGFHQYLPFADVVVVRSGLGGLADASARDVPSVVLTLPGHEEHSLKAMQFRAGGRNRYVASSISEAHNALRAAIAIGISSKKEPGLISTQATMVAAHELERLVRG